MGTARFPRNDWPTLGVELELQLVDSRTMGLRGEIAEILQRLPSTLQDSVRPEFLQCYVEVNSGVCRTAAEVGSDLSQKLELVARAAARSSVRLAWGGTHPFSHWQDQRITPDARYYELADLLQETVRRPVTFGLHVHVGVDSGDTAIAVGNRIQEHLPALLALSSNSPFWGGRATGFHAHRIELLEGFPTGGLAPLFRDWNDFNALVDRMVRCGFIKSEKELWWDVRPNREHGTVEVRICDMPADLAAVLGLAALIQCLVDDLTRRRSSDSELDGCFPLLVRQNRWRAARFGLGAALVDHRSGRPTPAWQAVCEMTDRLEANASRLGCLPQLAYARTMAENPSGAERQLALYQRTGDLTEVVRLQIGEPSPAPTSASRHQERPTLSLDPGPTVLQ